MVHSAVSAAGEIKQLREREREKKRERIPLPLQPPSNQQVVAAYSLPPLQPNTMQLQYTLRRSLSVWPMLLLLLLGKVRKKCCLALFSMTTITVPESFKCRCCCLHKWLTERRKGWATNWAMRCCRRQWSSWWWSVPFIARANNRPVWTMWSEDWLSLQTEGDVSSQSLSFLRLSFFHCDYRCTALKNECRVSVVVVVVNNTLLLTDQPVKRPRMTDWPRNRLTTTTITCRKWEKECRVFREEEKNREGQNKFKK